MKHYIVWLSSKGSKEIYTIVDDEAVAYYMRDWMNNWYKENNRKARAYLTTCEDGEPYYHNEIKKRKK